MHKVRQAFRFAVVATLLISGISACSLLGHGRGFVKPEVQLSDIRIRDASLLQTTLEFDVQVFNENEENLFLKGGSHRVFLNDTFVGKGFLADSVLVPSFKSAPATIRLYVSNLTLLSKLVPILESRAVDYRLDSALLLSLGNVDRRVEVESADRFEITGPIDTNKLRPFVGL